MKKILTLLLISIYSISFAQENPKLERIKTLRIAFFSDKLDLTTNEAQKFWPIYNEFESKQTDIRKQKRVLNQKLKSRKAEQISDIEVNQILDDSEKLESDIQTNRKRFSKDLQGVIPMRKILLLRQLEDDFKRLMLDQIGKRRQNPNRN